MFSGYLSHIPGTKSIQREIWELRASIHQLARLAEHVVTFNEVERLILFKKTRLFYLRRVIDITLARA